jgi:hypothetical protein
MPFHSPPYPLEIHKLISYPTNPPLTGPYTNPETISL